jgi:hypothetical protein
MKHWRDKVLQWQSIKYWLPLNPTNCSAVLGVHLLIGNLLCMFRQRLNHPWVAALVVQLLPIILEQFALTAPPSQHSFFTKHHIVDENVSSHK